MGLIPVHVIPKNIKMISIASLFGTEYSGLDSGVRFTDAMDRKFLHASCFDNLRDFDLN